MSQAETRGSNAATARGRNEQLNQIRYWVCGKENLIEKKQTYSEGRKVHAMNSGWIKYGDAFNRNHSQFNQKCGFVDELGTDIDVALEFV